MYTGKTVSVLGWILLLIIMNIPVVNVIFVIWMFIRRRANQSIKNFFVAYLIFYVFAMFGMFNGVFDNFAQLWG